MRFTIFYFQAKVEVCLNLFLSTFYSYLQLKKEVYKTAFIFLTAVSRGSPPFFPVHAGQCHVFLDSQRPPLLSISYGMLQGFMPDSSVKAGEMGSVGSEGPDSFLCTRNTFLSKAFNGPSPLSFPLSKRYAPHDPNTHHIHIAPIFTHRGVHVNYCTGL